MNGDPAEEVEHIPWSQLLEEHRAARPWLVYVAAGVVAAAALGVIGARALRSPASSVVVEAPTSTTPAAGEGVVEPAVPVVPYSEADLMAGYPEADARAAAARAEWFVTDYFTRDETGEGRPTAVEWARAVEVTGSGSDRFRVTVAFRSVNATGSGWVRGPARAVTVIVSGASTIVDLPEPAAIPATLVDAPLTGAVDPPAAVAGAALEAGSAWGADPVLVGADRREGGGWRIVIEVHDEAGRSWPLVVNLDEDGTPAG